MFCCCSLRLHFRFSGTAVSAVPGDAGHGGVRRDTADTEKSSGKKQLAPGAFSAFWSSHLIGWRNSDESTDQQNGIYGHPTPYLSGGGAGGRCVAGGLLRFYGGAQSDPRSAANVSPNGGQSGTPLF